MPVAYQSRTVTEPQRDGGGVADGEGLLLALSPANAGACSSASMVEWLRKVNLA
ncbi:MAG: hypothetical protein IJ012_05295 [Clostridia bacterium]|nr:hypothetical protein [Clostridia bacterium]